MLRELAMLRVKLQKMVESQFVLLSHHLGNLDNLIEIKSNNMEHIYRFMFLHLLKNVKEEMLKAYMQKREQEL